MTAQTAEPDAGAVRPSSLSWAVAIALLAWIAALHLGAVVCFAIGLPLPSALAPVATVAALALAWRLGSPSRLAALLTTTAVFGLGAVLAATFLDLSWDGQWYHQTAIYQMQRGWNPIRDPVPAFAGTWSLWVLHYAKGPWLVGAVIMAATGSIELAKITSVVAPPIAAFVLVAMLIERGLTRPAAVLVAITAVLNPVTTCGLLTHQVDGILVSLLASTVAAGIAFLRRPAWQSATVLVLGAALCANTKFTGVVYLCFFFLAGAAYALWRHRAATRRFVGLVALGLGLGVGVFGFNPYVTNTVHRGHPFYPLQGSAQYPSLAAQGEDPIEKYETPANLVGRNRFVRLAYGIFGKPGSAPYDEVNAARFMWPFAVTRDDFARFYFQDVRIGGFGPLFGGVLLLAAGLTPVAVARRALSPDLLLLAAPIAASLLVSIHTWWARYGPHLWWLPIVPLAALIAGDNRRLRRLAAVLLGLLLVNTVALSAVHLRWEWRSSQALRQQLRDLRTAGPIIVDLAYFDVPVAERLRTAGIAFETMAKYSCPAERDLVLMSVARRYPGAVHVCLASAARAAELGRQPHWRWPVTQ